MFFKHKYHKKFNFIVKSPIRNYHCYVRLYYTDDNELFELDVYDSPTTFKDGHRKYLHESAPIDQWEDEPFNHYQRPLELARQIITQYEQKDRLARSIKNAKGIFDLEPKERQEKGHVVNIHDYQEVSEKDKQRYYLKNIAELDKLKANERAELFKQFGDLKAKYKAFKWGVTEGERIETN